MFIIHHSALLSSVSHHGYIAVEFFFIISGFFLGKIITGHPTLKISEYMKQRLWKLYPHYFFSLAVMFAAVTMYHNDTFKINHLIWLISEALFYKLQAWHFRWRHKLSLLVHVRNVLCRNYYFSNCKILLQKNSWHDYRCMRVNDLWMYFYLLQ